jgi:hypothetical protein
MSNTTISYAISACNEHDELAVLLETIYSVLTNDDEIIIVTDITATQEVLDVINNYRIHNNIHHYTHALNKNFANHKNFINSCCKNAYILNMDADENISESLLKNIKTIIELNPDIDAYKIPRVNIVDGITIEYIESQHWNYDIFPQIINTRIIDTNSSEYKFLKNANLIMMEKEDSGENMNVEITYITPIINFPDFQCRLFKNTDSIKWVGKVHETLSGYKAIAELPQTQEFCLYHFKSLERQMTQNNFYTQI